jgi:hypothetical protein
MTPYQFAVSFHVIVAILGLGQLTGMVVVGSAANSAGPVSPVIWTALRRLTRGTTWSLVLLFLSGALVEFLLGGSFHDRWWFRLSVLLWMVLGGLLGSTRRALRAGETRGDAGVFGRVVRNAIAMCTVAAAITILMEAKPW